MSNYSPQFRDVTIIPDKYNTGCTGTQTLVDTSQKYDSLNIGVSGDAYVINGYANGNCNENIYIEDVEFDKRLSVTNPNNFGKVVKIHFINCLFKGVANINGPSASLPSTTSHVEFIFNNCTFTSTTSGIYMTMNDCCVTGTHADALNPNYKFYLNNCYIYDLSDGSDSGLPVHVDGIQMAGNSNYLGGDFTFNNVRIELPKFHATINAPYMYSVDYHTYGVNNIITENCIFNGGGYTLYLTAQGGTWEPHRLTNCRLGSTYNYGTQYPTPNPPNATLNNVAVDNTLFISSVWKDYDNIHLITTNPSTANRTLKVVTNKGENEYTIAKNYSASELLSDNPPATTFAELPIDIDKTISSDGVNWLVCFDITDSANPIQIRYVEFEPSPIEGYIDHIELNGTTYSIYDKEALHGNIVTTIDSSSTDNDIPTAKAVYDSIPVLAGKELISNKVTTISSESTDSEYPSAKCLYLLLGDLEDRLEDI